MSPNESHVAISELSAAISALTSATASLTAVSSAIAITAIIAFAIRSASRSARKSRVPSSQARSQTLRRALQRNAACVVGDRPSLESIQCAFDESIRGPIEAPATSYGADATRDLLNRAISRLALLGGMSATSLTGKRFVRTALDEVGGHLPSLDDPKPDHIAGVWPCLKKRPCSTPSFGRKDTIIFPRAVPEQFGNNPSRFNSTFSTPTLH